MKNKLKETKALKAPAKTVENEKTARVKDSKTNQVIALLSKTEGATIAEIRKLTGWQQHSVHGFMSGTLKKKMQLNIESEKTDGLRKYKISK